jgi:LPXTG-motif cell wall-anchored protein
VTAASLKPGAQIKTTWPMRLIKAGHYRVVVSAATRSGATLSASPFAEFHVRQKPVVESNRVLPIALGLPLLMAGGLLWQRRRRRAR